MTYKQRKRFTALVRKISSEAQLDASIVLHFINTDLERIYEERVRIHTARLQALDAELTKLSTDEGVLVSELSKKDRLLQQVRSRVETTSASLNEKSESLARVRQDVVKLEQRLADLNLSTRGSAKVKNQLEYDLLIKSHRQRELTSKGARAIHILLAIFFIVGVAIAALLIWRH